MLLENLDQIFDRAAKNLCTHIDAFVDAQISGTPRPQFVGIPLAKKQKSIRSRAADNNANIFDVCKRALSEVETMEKMAKRGKGPITAGEFYLLRQEGIYLTDATSDVNKSLGAFIDADLQRIDMTHGLPGRMALLTTHQDDTSKSPKERKSTRILMTLEQLTELPFDQIASGPGIPYLYRVVWGWGKRDQVRVDFYVTIQKDGIVNCCFTPAKESSMVRLKKRQVDASGRPLSSFLTIPKHGFKMYDRMWYESKEGKSYDGALSSAINQTVEIWQTRFFFPTMRVNDKDGRSVVVSIREHDIPKILKSRDANGERKEVMLHWVTSHQRSTQSAVRTHMRGKTDCTIGGYFVDIRMPGYKDDAPTKIAKSKLTFMNSECNLPITIENTTSNNLLAKLFASAGVQYKTKEQQKRDWQRLISAPISIDSVYAMCKNDDAAKTKEAA